MHPRVALCLAGAARSFTSPLVLDHLRRNLLKPLTGQDIGKARQQGSRIFLSLKTADSKKRAAGISFRQHRGTVEQIRDVILTTWLRKMVGEAVIINGSGAFLGSSSERLFVSEPSITIVPSNDTLWRSFRATPCGFNISTGTTRHCCRKSGYLLDGNNEERLIHQHLGMRWCRAAIERAEARTHQRFDVVAFARPDLVWWTPLPDWCRTPLAFRNAMWSCDKPGCDMAWVASRSHMERLFGQAEAHRDCSEVRQPTSWQRHNVRAVASCCSTSEWLLWYVQSGRGAEGRAPATSLPASRHEIPVWKLGQLEPDRGAFTLLREANGTCELVLAATYPRDRRQLQQQKGLSVATGSRIRTLFGASFDNISACRHALLSVRSRATGREDGALADEATVARLSGGAVITTSASTSHTEHLRTRAGPLRSSFRSTSAADQAVTADVAGIGRSPASVSKTRSELKGLTHGHGGNKSESREHKARPWWAPRPDE